MPKYIIIGPLEIPTRGFGIVSCSHVDINEDNSKRVKIISYLSQRNLDEYETKGLVADCRSIRENLLNQVQICAKTKEEATDELLELQRSAHARGLFICEDFKVKNDYNDGFDLEEMEQRRIIYRTNSLEKELQTKISNKSIKI